MKTANAEKQVLHENTAEDWRFESESANADRNQAVSSSEKVLNLIDWVLTTMFLSERYAKTETSQQDHERDLAARCWFI